MNTILKALFAVCLLLIVGTAKAQCLEEKANEKKAALETLIGEAEKNGIDAAKEKMTIRTAEIFLKYANWDEANVTKNTEAFKLVAAYKSEASKYASELPDYERNEVIKILDEASQTLQQLIAGTITRKPIPKIDWTKVTLEKDQLLFEDRPVFLADYTWKPGVDELTEYFGNQDGYYLDGGKVSNANGDINTATISNLQNKADGSIGFIFLGHKNAPQWAKSKYDNFTLGKRLFTGYDIDNPGAREMNSLLINGTVPLMAGKKYTQLGYMLCNEPHWFTMADTWATGEVSEYTKTKFRNWLGTKHTTINELNTLWGTHFAGFDDVTITIPIAQNLQGSPQWFDWVSFNMFRVSDWFAFLKREIKKNDPQAKVHLKVMPNLWSNNLRDHGLNFETLTNLSDIIGNDAGAENSYMWGDTKDWEEKYSFEWRELCMSYDFFKSVSPEKIIYNTELHFLSKGNFRDLYLDPMYARGTFWLAHIFGLNASQTWFWARLADGSIKNSTDKGYAGSNNQQPRIVNEVASTMMDLNSYSEEITAFQRLKKPLRIFYSETSAINKKTHMDDVFELYEALSFDGIPLGFVTDSIIRKQNNSNWEAVLIHKTEFVTQKELESLQSYLDNGGTIIVDANSLKKDEYGRSLSALTQSNGTLLMASSVSDIKTKALQIIEDKGLLPDIKITETNSGTSKACIWRIIKNKKGNNVLSIINAGKTDATLNIQFQHSNQHPICKDLLNGTVASATPKLKPYQVFFVEIVDESTGLHRSGLNSSSTLKATLYPNPSNGEFNLLFPETLNKVDLSIFNLSGNQIEAQSFFNTGKIAYQINSHPNGAYIVKALSGEKTNSFVYVKQ